MNVQDFLHGRNVRFECIPHRETFDAQRMAAMIHVSGREVAKTVLLRCDDGGFAVAVLPANRTVDFGKASRLLGGKGVEMATEIEMLEHCPDCEIGALPPFGSQYGMKTLVDENLAEEDEVVFSGNTHHEAFRMNFKDFRNLERPVIGNFTH